MEASFKFDEWEAHHWTELQSLYHLAADAPPGQRTRVLRAATTDEGLMQRVLNLLEMDSEDEFADAGDRLRVCGIDERVGRYRLVRLLGSGGLGAVYLAERLHGGAVRQYALKVLSLHAVGPEMQTRFLREQQLLALLQHANIPRMLDAGFTDTGSPYLVMEYIDGEAITTHCDAAAMTVPDRVRLMLQVCEAVAYAHRMLVVHLDLKPQNILVSKDGQAKLLDFGTSKLLDAELTLTTTILATPAYASPEQLRNEPVTTACDVYGLGAVLYELLCGSRPWGNSSPTLILEHALREDEPPPFKDSLSEDNAQARGEATVKALRQRLQGDVQSIVARCLRSRAASRYGTVDELAQDLRRYLDGRPVAARKQTVWYRTVKFIRRHRTPVYSAALAMLLVFSSLVYAGIRQHQALVAAHRAVQMQQFMARLFELAHRNAMGKPDATVSELLRLGASRLPLSISDPADLRAARLSVAQAMASNDDKTDALPLLESLIVESDKVQDIPILLRAKLAEGVLYLQLDDEQKGLSLVEDAYMLEQSHSTGADLRLKTIAWRAYGRGELNKLQPTDIDALKLAIAQAEKKDVDVGEREGAYNILGLLSDGQGLLKDAESAYTRAFELQQQEQSSGCDQGDTLKYLGHVKRERKNDEGALVDFRRSYELERACAGPDALQTLASLAWEANALVMLKRPQEALDLLAPTMPQWYLAAGKRTLHLRLPLSTLARAYLQTGRLAEAERTSREALRAIDGQVQRRSSVYSVAESDLGEVLLHERKFSEAATFLSSSLADYPSPPNPTPSTTAYRQRLEGLVEDAKANRLPSK